LKPRPFILLLFVATGLLAYQNSFRDGFVFDDIQHIVQNPRIRQPWRPWEVITHSSRPVVDLSLAVNDAIGGLDPWGYHVFNLGVHILAALTLYGVARRTLVSETLRSRFGGAAPFLAGAISLIWLVHPLQTESVTYTIQRGESLMGLFFLLTLYCVIRSSGSSRRVWWETGAVVSCALAMGCKPVAASAPVVALLYERAFLAGSWREISPRRWKMHAGLAATWLLLALLLANGPQEWKGSAGFDYAKITPVQYALTQPGVILRYLRLAFWPRPLCLDYAWPAARTAAGAWPGLIAVGGLLVVTAWAWRRKPALGFPGAWFFIILAPTSSFIPIADPAFEHRMYLPLAAVVAVVVLGAFEIGKRLFQREQGVVLGCVASGSVVALLTFLTIQRNRDYTSALTIWQDTVEKRPNNPLAHRNLGTALEHAGRIEEAIAQYEQALRLQPDDAEAHYNLGNALAKLGRTPEAIAQYEQALRIKPDLAMVHSNLGATLIGQGRVQEGIGHYEQALRINPNLAITQNNLGLVLDQLGRLAEAIGHYEQALRIQPGYAEAHYNLGNALEKLGRTPAAIAHYEQALRIKPDFVQARNALARARAVP